MTQSPEDAVQIPGRRAKLGLLIEAFAEHPVAMPVFVCDAVIVARPRTIDSVLAPPLRGEVRRRRRRRRGGGYPSIAPPGSAFSLASLPIKGRDDFCSANQTTPPFRR